MEDFFKEVNIAITVCDKEGNILSMNDKSVAVNSPNEDIIGRNLMDCHPPMAQKQIADMLQNHNTNAYTIEKNGQKKLIYQTPWYKNGEFSGLIEFSIVLPENMPHFIRKPKV